VPFVASKDATGRIDGVSYQGALVPTEAPVAPGVTADMNVVGSEIFQGGGDLFGAVIELRDAIRTGDVEELRTLIGDLDRGRDAVLRGVGRLGERQAQIEILRNSTERMRQLNEQIISDRRDADMAELSVEYNSQMALLKVVMQVAASSAKPSIADFL
jgi:flagellar hook-associated protein 3 FlgL